MAYYSKLSNIKNSSKNATATNAVGMTTNYVDVITNNVMTTKYVAGTTSDVVMTTEYVAGTTKDVECLHFTTNCSRFTVEKKITGEIYIKLINAYQHSSNSFPSLITNFYTK